MLNYTKTRRWAIFSIVFLGTFGLLGCQNTFDQNNITSPDGRTKIDFSIKEGIPYYKVLRDNTVLISESRLGLDIQGLDLTSLKEIGQKHRKVDDSWKPVWGKRKTVINNYREMTVKLVSVKSKQKLDIEFRAFNDGVAFRYVLGADGKTLESMKVNADHSEFAFAGNYTAWFYNGEWPNVGPIKLADVDGKQKWPMTIKVDNNCYMAIMEAAIYDFGWMELTSKKNSNTFTSKLTTSDIKTAMKTPWRVIAIGDKPGALIDSDILENLNPPCAIADTSWIKPGISFWDWRAWGHKADDGFTYDLDMDSWKRFVDLAAESGIPYLLIDADWYGKEFSQDSDPTTTDKGVPALVKYANSKNIGVFLYLNDVGAKKYGLEKVLKAYADWGAIGIKYGFMRVAAGQPKIDHTRKVIQLCAKYKLMCDFHDGPVPPCGDSRTWPNCITREFCHSQSDAKRAFTPGHFCTQVFVNMLPGAIDMCNGMFDLENSVQQRPRMFEEVHTTIVAEAARVLIAFSGLCALPDSADSYRKHPELFNFLAKQKMPWTQSKTLAGEIGQYIVMMRSNDENIFIASATNEQAREIEIKLDFLETGKYQAILLEDATDTHYINNRQAYQVKKTTISAGDTIKIKMAPGGGHCMILTPTK
ncbi:MAG: glycoside hydrolase family 97 catalytic domain-containing protein [Phycisphaerae bacterium]|nr:glycoside hydrolase family 97 catalytic domain-containing protein [Phycisphaerae bacterium]